MTPIQTLNHNNKTIEIYQDEDAQNPRKDYAHLGLLAISGQYCHLSDEGEQNEDQEEWLIAMIDVVDSKKASRINRIDELIDRVQGQRSYTLSLCRRDPDRRPEKLFTSEEARDEQTLLAWQHQLDLFRKARVVLPDLLEDAFHLGLTVTFSQHLTEASKALATPDRLRFGRAVISLRDRAANRLMKSTDHRLKTLIEGRQRLVEDALNQHYIALPVGVYDHGCHGTQIKANLTPGWDPEDCDGWIYLPWKKAREEFSGTDDEIKEKVLGCMRGEIDEFNAYLQGEVYGFVITGEDGERLDSCWGFYGFDYCLEEAKSFC